MLGSIARTCYSHRRIVLVLWIAGFIAAVIAGGALKGDYSTQGRLPGTDTQSAYDLLKKEGKPFFPYAVMKDSTMALIVVLVIAVMAIVLIVSSLLVRGSKLIPGRGQNIFELFYEGLSDFGTSIAGAAAKPYIPLFAAFFLLILFCNWSGLVPPVGRVEFLRAPTSDVNVTLGLALVSFLYFEFEGFRKLGFRGYAGKFFPIYEFKKGIAAGGIALFVGLVELMLEFVKPVTLTMRLCGNIYGGEVALGVITALTLAVRPVGTPELGGERSQERTAPRDLHGDERAVDVEEQNGRTHAARAPTRGR